jgi:putative transposase
MFKRPCDLTRHTKKDHLEEGAVIATRRVEIYPNARDRNVLKRWFGCNRAIYNHTIDYCEKSGVYKYEAVRPKISNEASIPEARAYLRDLPSDIRKLAVKDACTAYDSNFAKREIDPNHKFEMGYRSKKDRVQTLKLEHDTLFEKNGRLHLFKKSTQLSGEGFGYNSKQIDLTTCTRDFSLSRDADGRFWLNLSITRFPALEIQEAGETGVEKSQCAIDPGVRTFLTTYSPNGESFKLGDGAATKLYRLLIHLDKLIGQIDVCKGRRQWQHKRGLKRAAERLRARIKNLTTDLHWQSAAFLCCRYDTIVIPPFQTQKMSRRANRRIHSKTVRQMLVLSHYTFRQRLLHAAKMRGSTVAVMTEEYTSKTCTSCGFVHSGLGSNKVFRCPSCRIVYDRDAGGSRNIFVKNYEF